MHLRKLFVHRSRMIKKPLLFLIFPLIICEKKVSNDMNLEPVRAECLNSSICKEDFSVSYIRNHKPYVHNNNTSIITNVIELCCGHRTNIIVSKNLSHIGEFDPKSNDAPDFVFPVLAQKGTLKKYGYHFVPVYRLESVILISRSVREVNIIGELINSGILILISFELVQIAGFIIWFFETWKNQEEFPRAFPIGWFKGTWFSFVSMTTVGYGDQTPKSVAGKLFACVWIYISLILCSMMTATITSSLLNQSTPPPPPVMKGERIGMIKHRDFESYVTASLYGYKVVEVEGEDSFYQLLKKVKEFDIDGFVIERRAYHFFDRGYTNCLQPNECVKAENLYLNYKREVDFFLHNTLVTEKKYTGPELFYGILMKRKEYNDYFGTVIKENSFKAQLVFDEYLARCYRHGMPFDQIKKAARPSSASTLFSTSSYYFQATAITAMCLNFLLLIIGIVYELIRRKGLKMSSRNVDPSIVSPMA